LTAAGVDFLPFVFATFSLLAIPGPTNTLLAMSGGDVGVARSLRLLAAELCGYLTAVALLRVVLGPLVISIPIAGVLLRTAISVYLFHIARLLWQYRPREARGSASITCGAVLLTTVLNPKATIFAFLLLPSHIGLPDLLPWVATMAVEIVTVGAAWLVLGATLGRGMRDLGQPELMYRLGAIVLAIMATIISAQSLGITLRFNEVMS
jgi:threonine/homoserine/homoserine lactone efflux protein